MIEYLYNSSILNGVVAFCSLIVIISLLIYLMANYLIKNSLTKGHQDMGKLLFRSGASLLAFILSITFANERVNYFTLKSSIEAEATKLVDIHIDLRLLNTPDAKQIQLKIREYIISISEDGWVSLLDNPFDSKQVKQFLEIYTDINRLEASNEFEKTLKTNMLSDIDEVSDFLQTRIYSSGKESNHLIYTSFFGLTVIMILFATHSPNKVTLSFLGIYVFFIGVVLYFILMMSSPLRGPLKIDPGPFIIIKEKIEATPLQ